MIKSVMFFLAFLGLGACVRTNMSDNPNVYHVNAEISALKNRTLAARVRGHTVIMDQPRDFGADDLGPTPPEMLALAYGGCVASTMQLLAARRAARLENIVVKVTGDIDFSRALGVDDKHRAGFSDLNLEIKFDSDMSPRERKSFMRDVMRIGAVIDNVDHATRVNYTIAD